MLARTVTGSCDSCFTIENSKMRTMLCLIETVIEKGFKMVMDSEDRQ